MVNAIFTMIILCKFCVGFCEFPSLGSCSCRVYAVWCRHYEYFARERTNPLVSAPPHACSYCSSKILTFYFWAPHARRPFSFWMRCVLQISSLTECCEIEKRKMSGTCRINDRWKVCTKWWSAKLKVRDHCGDLGVECRASYSDMS
jgi:hypothetical protein